MFRKTGVTMYDFEPDRVRQFLERHKVRRAAIQLPAGLRGYLPEILPVYDDLGVETLILGDSCYGGCDVADILAKRLGCDVLVHYGHSDMGLSTCLPVLYVEARMSLKLLRAIEQALTELEFKRVGLATTVQHVNNLKDVVEVLRSRGLEPILGPPGWRAKYPGQILGCDLHCVRSVAKDVDGFLYLGTGRFHPLGISLSTGKQVVVVNPVTGRSEKFELKLKDFLRRRRAMIARAVACERFGVVVSVKPGQARFKLASTLLCSLQRAGIPARLLVVDEVRPEDLADFRLDAFVCVACPRIPIDDAERFDKPVLTPFEAMVMLGETSFEPYKLDEVRREDFEGLDEEEAA